MHKKIVVLKVTPRILSDGLMEKAIKFPESEKSCSKITINVSSSNY